MTTQTRRLTYEEYLELPEIMARYDIIDGEMIMAPGPTLEHQSISRQLFRFLDPFVTEHQLGEVYYAPLDILVQRSPLRTRQPDLMFISNDRREIMGQIIEGAPDLVVEILSLGNRRRDIEAKLADYARLGVRECWLISPEARTVEVLTLHDGTWQRADIYGLGDILQSSVLPGLELEVSQIFV